MAAKRTVESKYSVVGLQEDMEGSLLLMQKLIPKFMANAISVFNSKLIIDI